MKELNMEDVGQVAGGDRWGAEKPDGTACANTMLAWAGVGSMVGGAIGGVAGGFGGMIGSFGGFAAGGGLAARYSQACR